MESKVVRSYLQNTPVSGDCVVTNGTVQVTGWFPINQNQVISAQIQPAVLEVRQYVLVNPAAAIIAFNKYQVAIGNTGNRREGAQNQVAYFGYTAPAILTGNAAQDKYNMEISIAYKINKTSSARANAGAEVSITHGAVTGSPYTLYEVVVGGTSGAMGYFISDTPGGASAGTIVLAEFTPYTQFISGETLTGQTSGAVATTTAVPTVGLGLAIIDIGNYMSAYTRGLFQGPNTVLVTQGFASTDLTIVAAGVISYGIGTNLQYFIPQSELLSNNLRQGLFAYPTVQTLIVANNYTAYFVTDQVSVRNDASAGIQVGAWRVQAFYASNGAYPSVTPPSAFNTAFETAFPQYVIV